ncbi:MAG: hypothetical protein NTX05_02860 [Fusobacteria bacterium]|nr:hypothetical protein [Fusobacteriota bacterium]
MKFVRPEFKIQYRKFEKNIELLSALCIITYFIRLIAEFSSLPKIMVLDYSFI